MPALYCKACIASLILLSVSTTLGWELSLQQLPSNVVARLAFLVQPEVRVLDPNGSPAPDVASDSNRRLVEIEIATAGSARQSLRGNLALYTTNGVARFTDLRLMQPGPTTLRIFCVSIDADLQATTPMIQVREGITNLLISPPPTFYPSGSIDAGAES